MTITLTITGVDVADAQIQMEKMLAGLTPEKPPEMGLDELVEMTKTRLADAGFRMEVSPVDELKTATEIKVEQQRKTRPMKISPEQAKEVLQAKEEIKKPNGEDPETIKAKCLLELQTRFTQPGGDEFVRDILAKHGGGADRLSKVKPENFVEIAKALWGATDARV